MGRRSKNPGPVVIPPTKKQLIDKAIMCKLLGNISTDTLDNLRNDPAKHFPVPLQIVDGKPLWSVDQFERFVNRKEKEIEALSA